VTTVVSEDTGSSRNVSSAVTEYCVTRLADRTAAPAWWGIQAGMTRGWRSNPSPMLRYHESASPKKRSCRPSPSRSTNPVSTLAGLEGGSTQLWTPGDGSGEFSAVSTDTLGSMTWRISAQSISPDDGSSMHNRREVTPSSLYWSSPMGDHHCTGVGAIVPSPRPSHTDQ
jgi:hypothetical protein